MGRAPFCDKANVKKGPWSPEEDEKLKSYIETNGTGGNWIALPRKIGLKRCGKSCRLRWLNYLRPNIKHGGFSEEEEENIICTLYLTIGSRWSIIAAQLPGRTDNDIKNYWNTRLKKKIINKQRKELQEVCMEEQEMMVMMKRQRQEQQQIQTSFMMRPDQTMFTWPLQQGLGLFMNQTNLFYDHEDFKPVIMKNMVKLEDKKMEKTNINHHQDSMTNAFDHLSFSQLLLDPNQNQLGLGDGFSMNSILSANASSPLVNSGIDHQWLETFQAEAMDLFSGAATSTSADQSTISWEDISSLVYSDSKQIYELINYSR